MNCIYRSLNLIPSAINADVYSCYNDKIHQNKCVIEDIQCPKSYAKCCNCDERVEKIVRITENRNKWKYVTTQQLTIDTLALASQVPGNCSGIVGVARSGLMPASILATHLHLPLYEISISNLNSPLNIHRIKGGLRISDVGDQEGPLFIVDDTVHDGNSAKLIREIFRETPHVLSAVYVRPDRLNLVDAYAVALEPPHFLEWNIFNSSYIEGVKWLDDYRGGIAFDFDGVLSHDPPYGADKSSSLDWLINAKPTHNLPRGRKIPLIVTMRLEKWRSVTNDWLRKFRIEYDRLEMLDIETVEERDERFIDYVIQHKANKFADSDCFMMIESDPTQAKLIHEYSKKPVLCPIEGLIHSTDTRS
jgi:orotate phosphoribosyltransferase